MAQSDCILLNTFGVLSRSFIKSGKEKSIEIKEACGQSIEMLTLSIRLSPLQDSQPHPRALEQI
jgi:hypothetical protein